MMQFLRKIFFRMLYITGMGHLLKYLHTKGNKVPILLFHRVSNNQDDYWPPMSCDSFKNIIQFFDKKYTIRPLKDLFTASPENLKGSCFIVFDDAYKDFLENAWPFLKERKIPVTMFVPVESVNSGKPIWTTWLNVSIDATGVQEINIGEERISYHISSQRSKIETAGSLTNWLKSLPYDKFKNHFAEIIDQTGENKNRSDIGVMSWSEIKSTTDEIDYQSHTMTHPMLGNIKKGEDLKYEIGDSKKILEEKLDISITYISYPIGSYSKTVMEQAREYYDAAFAVEGKLVELKKINDMDYRFRIPRFNVSDSDVYELFFRVNGFHKLFGR
jgi:peptidoglycan/xylan/chitin deacetylase (PgdA/CDA1 family)